MHIVAGTLLVLLTWAVAAALLAGLGFLPSVLTSTSDERSSLVRRAMWWGVLLVALFCMLINLVQPLRSLATGIVLLVLVAVSTGCGILVLRIRPMERAYRAPSSWSSRLLGLALVLAVVFLSIAALGPITNYDSGLYHLGAVQYAGDYRTIPGLANLYFAYGYGNAEFPLAALLGNGPWNGNGFRLLNGLLIALAATDVFLRFRERRGAGFYILFVGVITLLVPMLALADYWVTSPSQDSAVFTVTVIASAYLADAVSASKRWISSACVVLVLSALLVLLRPTMVAFAVVVVIVICMHWSRNRGSVSGLQLASAMVVVGVVTIASAAAAVTRDIVLSGWLQYPLSIHPFDVAWRAFDPVAQRLATLGYHRNASDLWDAAQSWAWIPGWFSRIWTQWETYEFLFLTAVATLGLIIVVRTSGLRLRWRAMLLVMAPSIASLAVWFLFTPPAFRFTWGALFMIPAILLGWTLWRVERIAATREELVRVAELALAAGGVFVIGIVGFCTLTRLHPSSMTEEKTWSLGIDITYSQAPIPTSQMSTQTLPSGLQVQVPVQSEQCWLQFPLCSPGVNSSLRLRGTELQEGLLP